GPRIFVGMIGLAILAPIRPCSLRVAEVKSVLESRTAFWPSNTDRCPRWHAFVNWPPNAFWITPPTKLADLVCQIDPTLRTPRAVGNHYRRHGVSAIRRSVDEEPARV